MDGPGREIFSPSGHTGQDIDLSPDLQYTQQCKNKCFFKMNQPFFRNDQGCPRMVP